MRLLLVAIDMWVSKSRFERLLVEVHELQKEVNDLQEAATLRIWDGRESLYCRPPKLVPVAEVTQLLLDKLEVEVIPAASVPAKLKAKKE